MLSAQTGPTDDWDGDGVLNQSDLDDDNDGILDINENLALSVNAIINGNFGTNGTTGGNLTGWTTNGAGTSSLTNWAAESGGAVSYMDGAEGLNLSQSNVPLKTASTPAFATFSVKVLSVNAFGTSINQGWGKMDFYLETTTGLVRIFRVSNPLTATLASPTTNIELIDSSLVLSLAINGDYISRSFATGSYFTITVNINTANLASSGLVLVQRKNGAVSGPNGQIGADDFIIDDVSYTYQTGVDTDLDGIPNYFDLDSDGDGCPDATEGSGGFTNSALVVSSINGGNIGTTYNGYASPINVNLGNTIDASGIPTIANGGQNVGSSQIISPDIDGDGLGNTCDLIDNRPDTDGDGIKDAEDIDDDNDGILDRVECPALTTNLASNGGFSAAAASLPNWYMGLANSPLPIAEPFTPTVNNITKTGNVYNYGFGAGLPSNSSLTGGLFDQIDGVNTATGVQYALQEQDPQRPLVSNIAVPLVAGATYKYTFDLSNRATVGSANKYIVLLYNADTKTPEKIISSGTLNTLPGTSSNPTYKNFTGNFIPQSSGNYYLLFYPSISGGLADDFVVDRVAVVGSGTALCDTDGDGIPNHLDTDSDNDGCSDAREAGVIDYIIANGGTYSSGTLNNPTSSSSPEVTVGNNTPANYGTNGFYTAIESNDTLSATYNGMYTYSNAINAAIASCTLFCYRPAVLSGTVLSTPQGITSLHRAGVDADNWPMVRKGAWTALEAKTKGFVPNRLTIAQINLIPAGDLREGMMVYNISSDCLYINTDGTPTGWKCFNTQACPD
ncbi:hypothetical protein [Chryseobacterium sp. CFS15]|uniref:hypothetical protein n=1 Tax=Chryseobacterium sp. CFS15 TaxID=2986946 RepID=UPI002809E5EC|nr:hypothetical protein [Chryseobacterium sp. CFS15]MDQ8144400.1 hypothetical protein [Chryseobacterium sp. CFS15]